MKYLLTLLLILPFTLMAHDDPEANHAGGPCWITELSITPVYCIFTKGTRLEHPNPLPEKTE